VVDDRLVVRDPKSFDLRHVEGARLWADDHQKLVCRDAAGDHQMPGAHDVVDGLLQNEEDGLRNFYLPCEVDGHRAERDHQMMADRLWVDDWQSFCPLREVACHRMRGAHAVVDDHLPREGDGLRNFYLPCVVDDHLAERDH
jgi:hypothetical protein